MSRFVLLSDRGDIDWPRVLLVALCCAMLAGLVFFSLTSSAAFGPFNPGWDGASDFRQQVGDTQGVELTTATGTQQYESVDAARTTAFVLAPDEQYDDEDVSRVQQFVERGGTLVVMENFGANGNVLLDDLGAGARVDGRLIRDEQTHDEAPTMPVATNVTEHPLTEDVEQLTLNYASVVDPANATVLVRTSEFAYLTENESVDLDDDTNLTSAPVATAEPVGDGTVVVVSDPSIVINVMLDRPDNAAFVGNIYRDTDRVLVDRSHSAGLPILTRAVLLVRGSALLQLLLGGLVITVVVLYAERRLQSRLLSKLSGRLGRRSVDDGTPLAAMSDEARAAFLREQHPDWDQERVDRVITAFKAGDRKGENQ